MTTKKQRRANVAAKTQKAREIEKALNLELLARSKNRHEQKRFDHERAERSKRAKEAIDKVANANTKTVLTPDEKLLHEIFSGTEEEFEQVDIDADS